MLYIKDIKEGFFISDHYLCISKQVLKTRAGKTYYSMKLQDKTGVVDAKVWDLNDGIDHFEEGDYIKIEASVVTFQSALQLNVRRLRRSEEGEYDPKDYIPSSKFDVEEMYQDLLKYINKIKNPYILSLVESFFVEDKGFIKKFKSHSAAKSIHHSYMGGLLEHTLTMVRICDFLSSLYKNINYDLLVAGALFHDMGKLKELSDFPLVEYTDEGQLIGHIVIGTEWVADRIKTIEGFPNDIAIMIRHMILSHHGEFEYGSPKKPALIEAIVLHYVDNIDAKINSFENIKNSVDEGSKWLGFQRIFEANIRRTDI